MWVCSYYCCKCSPYFTFYYPNGVCDACVPPAAANAANPAYTSGTSTYSWTCAPGYYGTPVSRTCSNANGAWSGSPITCTACAAPGQPTNGVVSKPAADTWSYTCNAGYFNPSGSTTLSLRCDTSSGALSPGGSVTCSACNYDGAGAGYYCTGSDTRRPCPGGTFGSVGATLTSPACSGTCLAGE